MCVYVCVHMGKGWVRLEGGKFMCNPETVETQWEKVFFFLILYLQINLCVGTKMKKSTKKTMKKTIKNQ